MKIILYVPQTEGNFLAIKNKVISVINPDYIVLDSLENYINRSKPASKRTGKYDLLMSELSNWGLDEDNEALKIISQEISWRIIMRVIHRLKRKRGAEQ